MSGETLRTLVHTANPVPDASQQPADEIDALISNIERRTSMVKQDERLHDVVTLGGAPPPKRRRWTVAAAAAAFAAIVLMVGSVAVLTGDPTTTTNGPATTIEPTTSTTATTAPPTTTTTTTTIEPTVATADRALIEGVVEALNAGDVERVLAYFTPDTLYLSGVIDIQAGPQPVSTWTDAVTGDVTWRAAIDSHLSVQSCEPVSTGIACDALSGSKLFDLAGGVSARLDVEIADGLFTKFVLYETQGFVDQAFIPFQRWMRDNHPGDFDTMFKQDLDDRAGQPHLTDESLALWPERLDEYVGPSPDEQAWIGALEAAYDAGDVEGYLALFADTTHYSHPWAGPTPSLGPISGWGQEVELEMRWRAILESDITIGECVAVNPARLYRCNAVVSDVLGRLDHLLFVEFDDGRPAVYYHFATGNESEKMFPFRQWLADNHPEDLADMFAIPGDPFNPTPKRADDSLALWSQRVPEYLASLEG